MRLTDLQYDLPAELIAQHPAEPRDVSRLLVLDRSTGRVEHRGFRDIGDYLAPGDALALNDTRVIPARFFGHRATGRRIEGLFVHVEDDGWRVLLRSSGRLKVGERLVLDGTNVRLALLARGDRAEWLAQPEPHVEPFGLLAQIGHTPLPPYIHRGVGGHGDPEPADADRYQTVYARQPGAVAAPTAGLHFTPELLESITQQGLQIVRLTLHVGPGTFVPIETDDLADHRMHAEWFDVQPAELAKLVLARAAGKRVVAVGTTSLRVLESLLPGVLAAETTPNLCLTADTAVAPAASPYAGWTRIFIYPPYRFRHADRLITNFHLPRSTLLALVMAFATPELIRAAYAAAIERRYRFYSYGDAMLIL